ncbi:uncharacterized protein BT62DRAFT_1007050 [Guyanagaster necrorhizus]|uniref:CCHC-type domain-containing protein n=1 Tax=Guyanagaster necrorhizus TaxID=856835 RepID=A0A9P8ARF4_9AGAR|nr:uncharacterized protein BT62DRAFT_1007050 [Guyanagaster necrorhizus MCA 3950]KAG7445338.1 hypothetical protein BT62DRAFT_1007050 [Guyanagaster necrorhizus MCA 3950]
MPTNYDKWKEGIRPFTHAMAKKGKAAALGSSESKSAGLTSLGSNTTSDNKTATSTMFGGQRKSMDIDKLKKEGKYFGCKEKGHLYKDCSK